MDPSLVQSGPESTQLSASTLPNKKRIGRYEVVRLLGRGAFGTVKLGVDIITGNNVAIKILKHRNVQSERDFEMIEREKKVLMLLEHPNIVKLLEIIEDDEKDATYLVFEYVGGGELFNYIVSKGCLAEPVARKFARQIVSALEYCHFNLVVHRDLKPENLLLDEYDNIKITDFGLANFITPNKFQTFCGSLHYAAPEILRSHAYGGPPVDIYALGIVLYCLVNGRQPFDAESAHDMVKKINQGLQYQTEVSKDMRDLIAKMLTVDPKKRITLAEVRMHPWILKDCKGPPASFLPKLEPVTEIDDEIMKELVSLGFKDKASNRHAILKNKDKQVVSAYQLCLTRKKETRSRSCSVSVSRQVTKSSISPSSSLSKLRRASVSNPTGIPYIDSHTRRGQMGQGAASVADLKVRKHIRDPNKRKTDNIGLSGPTPSETTQSDSSSKALDDLDKLIEDVLTNNTKPLVFFRSSSKRRLTTEIPYSPRMAEKNETLAEQPSAEPSIHLDSPTVKSSPSKKRELTSSGQFKCDTTTTKRTKEIKKQIATTALKCSLDCEKVSRYSFKLHKQDAHMKFDVEIVKMKNFKNLKGLKFKRLEGDIWQYKQVVTEFADALRI